MKIRVKAVTMQFDDRTVEMQWDEDNNTFSYRIGDLTKVVDLDSEGDSIVAGIMDMLGDLNVPSNDQSRVEWIIESMFMSR